MIPNYQGESEGGKDTNVLRFFHIFRRVFLYINFKIMRVFFQKNKYFWKYGDFCGYFWGVTSKLDYKIFLSVLKSTDF